MSKLTLIKSDQSTESAEATNAKPRGPGRPPADPVDVWQFIEHGIFAWRPKPSQLDFMPVDPLANGFTEEQQAFINANRTGLARWFATTGDYRSVASTMSRATIRQHLRGEDDAYRLALNLDDALIRAKAPGQFAASMVEDIVAAMRRGGVPIRMPGEDSAEADVTDFESAMMIMTGRHQRAIAALEQKVAELEARNADLESKLLESLEVFSRLTQSLGDRISQTHVEIDFANGRLDLLERALMPPKPGH